MFLNNQLPSALDSETPTALPNSEIIKFAILQQIIIIIVMIIVAISENKKPNVSVKRES